MKERIEIDLFDDLREDNQKFFRLLDSAEWEKLKAKAEDPANNKPMEVLIGEMLEGS